MDWYSKRGDFMTIGEMLKNARIDAGLTQKQLAEKCKMADSAIRKYESGRIVPKIKTITKIASALGMSTSDFISNDSYFEKSIDERVFFAEREIISRIRRNIKFERYNNPDGKIDDQLIKEWIFDLVPGISKKYALPEETLKNASDRLAWNATDIHLTTEIDDLPDHHRQVIDLMDTLNEIGQRVAVARIEELSQIPKYQKSPAGDDSEENTSAEKA